jgi:SAM-dependent methyltransferase
MKIFKQLYFVCHYPIQFLARPINKHRREIEYYVNKYSMGRPVKFLDFACGEGIFSNLFKGNSVTYFGLDKDIDGLSFGRTLYKTGSIIGGDERLCFRGHCFDFVLLSCALHHMTNAEVEQLMLELKRVVKIGGLIIIVEVVPPGRQTGVGFRLIMYLEEVFKKIRYCQGDFFSRFMPGEFEAVLSKEISPNFFISIWRVIGESAGPAVQY